MEPIVKGKKGAGERKGGDDTKLSKLGSRTSMFATKRERKSVTEAVLQDLSRNNGEIYHHQLHTFQIVCLFVNRRC